MNEQLIVSGRNIPELYPHLDVWGFGIPLYLFIGGLAAGILLFATYYYMIGKADKMPMTVKVSTIVPPIIIALGLAFLIGDLHHKPFFWQLLTHFRFSSPMSWGAWVLTIIFIMSIFWPLSFIDDIIKYFEENNRKKWANAFNWIKRVVEKISIIKKLVDWTAKNRSPFAGVLFILSIILGIYTGILLSTMQARPLWNTSILGVIFLTSGVSTGAAAIMWMSTDKQEKTLFSRIDVVLVITELILIGIMILTMIDGPQMQIQAVKLFLGGEFTLSFWILFIGLGLVFPLVLELLELKGYHVPIWVPAFFILAGGLLFRIIMVSAGQISHIAH